MLPAQLVHANDASFGLSLSLSLTLSLFRCLFVLGHCLLCLFCNMIAKKSFVTHLLLVFNCCLLLHLALPIILNAIIAPPHHRNGVGNAHHQLRPWVNGIWFKFATRWSVIRFGRFELTTTLPFYVFSCYFPFNN